MAHMLLERAILRLQACPPGFMKTGVFQDTYGKPSTEDEKKAKSHTIRFLLNSTHVTLDGLVVAIHNALRKTFTMEALKKLYDNATWLLDVLVAALNYNTIAKIFRDLQSGLVSSPAWAFTITKRLMDKGIDYAQKTNDIKLEFARMKAISSRYPLIAANIVTALCSRTFRTMRKYSGKFHQSMRGALNMQNVHDDAAYDSGDESGDDSGDDDENAKPPGASRSSDLLNMCWKYKGSLCLVFGGIYASYQIYQQYISMTLYFHEYLDAINANTGAVFRFNQSHEVNAPVFAAWMHGSGANIQQAVKPPFEMNADALPHVWMLLLESVKNVQTLIIPCMIAGGATNITLSEGDSTPTVTKSVGLVHEALDPLQLNATLNQIFGLEADTTADKGFDGTYEMISAQTKLLEKLHKPGVGNNVADTLQTAFGFIRNQYEAVIKEYKVVDKQVAAKIEELTQHNDIQAVVDTYSNFGEVPQRLSTLMKAWQEGFLDGPDKPGLLKAQNQIVLVLWSNYEKETTTGFDDLASTFAEYEERFGRAYGLHYFVNAMHALKVLYQIRALQRPEMAALAQETFELQTDEIDALYKLWYEYLRLNVASYINAVRHREKIIKQGVDKAFEFINELRGKVKDDAAVEVLFETMENNVKHAWEVIKSADVRKEEEELDEEDDNVEEEEDEEEEADDTEEEEADDTVEEEEEATAWKLSALIKQIA
jgi:hypothetical protein